MATGSRDWGAVQDTLFRMQLAERENGESVSQILTKHGADADGILRQAVEESDVRSVRLLLEEQFVGRSSSESLREVDGAMMLISSISGFGRTFSYKWVRIARLLMNAGANASLEVEMALPNMVVFNRDSCLQLLVRRKKRMTGENLRKMGFMHHVLLREEAVHAVSWSWPSGAAAPTKPGSPAAPTMKLRRARRDPAAASSVLLGGLLR